MGKVKQREIIDCSVEPISQTGYRLMEHMKLGPVLWNPSHFRLHLVERQMRSRVLAGCKLMEELSEMRLANQNILDFALQNERRIPRDWRRDEDGRSSRFILFLGTTYVHVSDEERLYVPCLHYGERGPWRKNLIGLDNQFGRLCPTLILK